MHARVATWDDDPPVGGQGVYVRELRRSLVARGVRVSTTAGQGRFAMRYRRITGKGHLDMSIALNRSMRPLLVGDPDVLHVSGGPGGLQLLRRLPLPVVYTAHHTYRLSHARPGARRAFGSIEARGYRRAAVVAAVSPSTADAVVELGVPRSRVIVISPGVCADEPAGPPVAREPGRMLFVGRLEAEKGPLDAVAAMQRVVADVPGARGYVVGSGTLAAEVGVAARAAGNGGITPLGRLSDDEVALELRRAEVVLLPSAFEGLGMVALEAMAAGAAVVGYDVTGLRDTIGPHGLLVPHGEVGQLAAACRRLLADAPLRHHLAAGALDAVRDQRSWSRCAEEFEELYRHVIDAA